MKCAFFNFFCCRTSSRKQTDCRARRSRIRSLSSQMNAASSTRWQENGEYQFRFLFFSLSSFFLPLLRFSICSGKVIKVLKFLDVTSGEKKKKTWLLVLAEKHKRGTENDTSWALNGSTVKCVGQVLLLKKPVLLRNHSAISAFNYYRNPAPAFQKRTVKNRFGLNS